MRINNSMTKTFIENLNKKYNKDNIKKKEETPEEITIRQMFEQQRESIERSTLRNKIEHIAKKLARGDKISPEDRALLAENDPELLRKSNMAASRREDVERRIKNARTKQEARSIMTQAQGEVAQAMDMDITYAGLLSEAMRNIDPDRKQNDMEKIENKKIDLKV